MNLLPHRTSTAFHRLLLCLVALVAQSAFSAPTLDQIETRLKNVNPSASTAHLTELAAGDGTMVTVGEQGTLAVSEDNGATWQTVDLGLGASDSLLDVAYGAGRYLIVGGSVSMLTAELNDLTTWELTGVPDLSSPNSVDFLNGQFVVIDGNQIATSTDGVSWQSLASIPEGSFSDITYAAGIYVLVGNDGLIYTSSDLETWFLEDADLDGWEKSTNLFGVTFAGDLFLVAGFSGLLMSSPDGTTWTRRDPPVSQFLFDAAYFGGAYWISGGGANFMKTTDFVEWERVSHPGSESPRVFAQTEDALYAAGRLGTLVRTTDGENWENLQGGITDNFADLVFAHDQFLAATYAGGVYASADGFDWNLVLDGGENASFQGLEDTGTHVYVMGSNGTVYRSEDGATWEEAGSTPMRVDSFCHHDGTWVIGSLSGKLAWSTDLTEWQTFEPESTEFITGLAYGNDLYVAMGNRGSVWYAGPDFQWQTATAVPGVSTRSSLGFIDGRFLAPGQGKAWESTDGDVWTEVEWFGASIANTVQKIEGIAIAHGYLGSFWASTDGEEWDNYRTRSDASITGMAYGNDRWVTVGSRGSILATEAQTRWRVLLGHEGNGSVESNVSLADPLENGTEIVLTATPDEGHILWYWDDLETEDLVAPVTVESDLLIKAVFIPTPNYTFEVEIQSGEETGSVQFDPMADEFPHGSDVTITAVPAEGYQFQRWQGSVSSRDNPLTLNMMRDHTLIVSFSEIPRYDLTTQITGEGTVQASPEQADYLRETEITLTATPADGHVFVRWTGNVTGSANPLTFPIRRNTTVTAVFEAAAVQYDLEVTTTGSGTVTVSPEGSSFVAGTEVTLTPVADAGHTFQRWTGAAGGSTVPLVVNMNAAKSINADFVSNDSYAGWSLTHFGDMATDEAIAGVNADPDGDDRPNAEEFAFVSDPNQRSSIPQLTTGLTTIDDKRYFTLSWQQRSTAAIVPEVSTDMIEFNETSVITIEESEADEQGVLSKMVRMMDAVGAATQAARLKISLP